MLGLLMLNENLFVLENSVAIVAPRLLLILSHGRLLLLPHREGGTTDASHQLADCDTLLRHTEAHRPTQIHP